MISRTSYFFWKGNLSRGEFALMRGGDPYDLPEIRECYLVVRGGPPETTFEHANDEYSHSRNTHFCTLQKSFRITQKLHLR